MVIGIDASRANIKERSGTEGYSLEVITRLVRQHPEHRYLLYLKEPPLPELARLGSSTVAFRILNWPPRALWNLVRLSLALTRDRPDVLFVPAHTIPLLHPRLTVTTLHDIGFEKFHGLYSKQTITSAGLFSRLLSIAVTMATLGRYSANEHDYHRWSARYAVKHAAHIITVSQFSKDEIVSTYGTAPERVSVVPNGFDQAFSQPLPASERQAVLSRYSIRLPYLYFIGRLEAKKNIDRIFQTFIKLHQDGETSLLLVLAGKPGFGFAGALARARRAGLANKIILTGWVDHREAIALMQQAAIFFFPSLYEGFGIPVLEAFASRVPVVTAATTALKEVTAGAAETVNPESVDGLVAAVKRLLHDEKHRQRLIERGIERASLFSWEQCAEQTYLVLKRVTNQAGLSKFS